MNRENREKAYEEINEGIDLYLLRATMVKIKKAISSERFKETITKIKNKRRQENARE